MTFVLRAYMSGSLFDLNCMRQDIFYIYICTHNLCSYSLTKWQSSNSLPNHIENRYSVKTKTGTYIESSMSPTFRYFLMCIQQS